MNSQRTMGNATGSRKTVGQTLQMYPTRRVGSSSLPPLLTFPSLDSTAAQMICCQTSDQHLSIFSVIKTGWEVARVGAHRLRHGTSDSQNRRKSMRSVITVLCALLLAISCSTNRAPSSSKAVRLQSGKEVRVYSITRITFGDKSHPPSLMLRYETALKPEDSQDLRTEVLEVWELLRPMADSAHDSYAMVTANEPVRGIVSSTRAFTYGFIRSDSGEWRMREPKK